MATESPAIAMLDARDVSTLLRCSQRHVYRLVDTGRMPPPVKLGALVRWSRASIEDWVATGCPSQTRMEDEQHCKGSGSDRG